MSTPTTLDQATIYQLRFALAQRLNEPIGHDPEAREILVNIAYQHRVAPDLITHPLRGNRRVSAARNHYAYALKEFGYTEEQISYHLERTPKAIKAEIKAHAATLPA